MQQPPGYEDPTHPSFVCKLSKAIYGLKQAPRAWNHTLKDALVSWGFQISQSNSSLYVLRRGQSLLLMLIYVDDVILTGNDGGLISEMIHLFESRFALKDLGPLSYFLGIKVNYLPSGIILTQSQYIEDLLHKVQLEHLSTAPTPSVLGKSLSLTDGTPLADPFLYRSTIGALQYLTNTRPDIAFIVNHLSQFLQKPTDVHWQAVKRVLRYLVGTKYHGLHISPGDHLNLIGFTDADWAANVDDRRSVGAYCVFLGSTLVSWSSKKQTAVARSSTESEYRALAQATSEIIWLQQLLQEIDSPCATAPILWCDNMSAAALATNPVFHARTKHIEIDVHFVRDHVLRGNLSIRYVPSADQIADCLTKSLTHSQFHYLRSKLGVVEIPTRLRGDIGKAQRTMKIEEGAHEEEEGTRHATRE